MTRVEVAALSLRIASIYVAVQAFLYLSQAVVFLDGPDPESAMPAWLGMATTGLLLALLAAVLFLGAPRYARRMFTEDAPMDLGSRPEVLGLALRLAGILVLDQAIRSSSNIWIILHAAEIGAGWSPFWALIVSTVLLAGAGTWLFFLAPAIAERSSSAGERHSGRLANVQAVSFSVVGVWLVANALPGVCDLVAHLLRGSSLEERDSLYATALGRRWWSDVMRAVLGLVLFLGNRGISGLWHRIQDAGLVGRRKEA